MSCNEDFGAYKLYADHVSYLYAKGTPFEIWGLSDVSVGFRPGRITGLIGHTGSGKSTLVSLMNALYRPTEGRILLDGADIWEKPGQIDKIRFRVGVVMQYPEYQLFDETVRADIGFGARNKGLDAAGVAAAVRQAAHFAGVPDAWMEKSPFELSGGQKRRVAIAGIMAMEPEVLVLDEPAAGLDPRGRRQILSGLREYVHTRGVTVILVSHSMEDMAYYCDDVVVMDHARIHATGTVSQIFSRARDLTQIGLNVPEVARIADRLVRAGVPLEGTLYTVEGVRDAIVHALEKGGAFR